MKKVVFGLMILLSLAVSAQLDQAKVDEEVKGLLNTYLSSIQTITDSGKSVDEKKGAKKALKGMITSPFIRVVNDQFSSANDSIISFKNYLGVLTTSHPLGVETKLLLTKTEISNVFLDKSRNTYRVTATVKKLVKSKTLSGTDTIADNKLTNLTFYFKTSQTPVGTYEPLKLDAIQIKGKEPVYYHKLSELQQYWVSLSPAWQKKITKVLQLPDTPNDYYLKRINGIKKIDVSDIPVDDLEPLKGLKGLKELDLSGVGLDTLLVIEGMSSLTHLNLSGNELKSVLGIEGCTGLEYLNISKNEIEDLSPLAGCVNMMSLHCAGNKIIDLSVMKKFSHLLTLDCQNNLIEDLTPLRANPGLKVLNVARNKDIEDLSPIQNSLAMGKLNVFNTAVKSLAPIARMTSIQELNVGYIKVTSIDEIKNLRNLTDLNISGNLITDFSALNNFRNIRKLNVSKTKVSDISPMIKMERIRELKAFYSDLSKVDIQRFKKKYPKCEITFY